MFNIIELKDMVQQVEWKDLKHFNTKEILIENNITLPWLFASLFFAYHGYYLLAIPFSAFFFLTGLRQVHNGFHQALGVNKQLTWWALSANSLLMMVSIHAVKYNHLRHHKHCLGEEDYKGKSAFMTWYGAILYGPIHVFLIHKITWKEANKVYRRNMLIELIGVALVIGFVFYFQISFLIYHTAIMVVGEFLMAFFAVWTVHHDTLDQPNIARTQRNKWKNILTYNMFYHLEHHLFPAVPTIKLPLLAKRIDDALPQLDKKITF